MVSFFCISVLPVRSVLPSSFLLHFPPPARLPFSIHLPSAPAFFLVCDAANRVCQLNLLCTVQDACSSGT